MKKWTSPSPYFSEKTKWVWPYSTGKLRFQQGFQWMCVQNCVKKIAKLSCWWRASKTLSSGPVLLLAVCLGIACMRWMGRPQEGKLNHLLLDSVPERPNLSGQERKDDPSQLGQSHLTLTWLVQDENGTDFWETQGNYHPALMVAAIKGYLHRRVFTALQHHLLHLVKSWGCHQPGDFTLHTKEHSLGPCHSRFAMMYWAHQWHSLFLGTEFLGSLNCVHQLFKVRHGTYLADGCWKTVSNTICLSDRLFVGF